MNHSSHTTLASAASRRSFLKASGALVIAVVWDPVLAHTTALSLVRQAGPYPRLPQDITGARHTFVLPLNFRRN